MKLYNKIIIGFIISVVLFLAADIIFFYYTALGVQSVFKSQEEYMNPEDKKGIYIPRYFIKLTTLADEYLPTIKNEMRPVQNPESSERPIIIFGCSYAAGYIFDNKETISYIMSKYSKRPVINRAISGWGIQHMLYQLQNDKKFISSIKNSPPRYVFYVLMDNGAHFYRLYQSNFPNILHKPYYFTYELQNGKLLERKPLFNLYYNFAIIRHIQNKIISKKVYNNLYKYHDKELFNFFILHFKTANNLINQYWSEKGELPAPRFIILTFEGNLEDYWKPQLKQMGIEVINIGELIGITDLQRSELGFFEPEVCPHPNGKLWSLVIPKLKEMYLDL